MLDAFIRPIIDPPLDKFGAIVSRAGVSPNVITIIGFCVGLGAILLIALEAYGYGLAFVILNRLFDGLDGGVARHNGVSDIGGYLDIVCDFIVYSGVAFAFAVAMPETAPWVAFLIFSYVGATSSFLAYAILAERHGLKTSKRGQKSIYYLGGICEGTETIAVMVIMCLRPDWVVPVAFTYGIMCWLTCLGRSMQAWRDFS